MSLIVRGSILMDASVVLANVPDSIRLELFKEYKTIVQNYAEHRWSPTELGAGRFCEIVYWILEGYGSGAYPSRATKPSDMVGSCRKLEVRTNVPRSFQILIPRTLPALYEVRNNRGVGHVGGDVDPNHMDATFVVSAVNWILAELVRVFHSLAIQEAQQLVDSIAERRIPLIWHGENVKRVLNPKIDARGQILILVASTPGKIGVDDLRKWIDYKNPTRFNDLIRKLHTQRLIEYSAPGKTVEILPPGSLEASRISDLFHLDFSYQRLG